MRERERERGPTPECKRKTSTDCSKKTSLTRPAGIDLALAGQGTGVLESGHVKTFIPNQATNMGEAACYRPTRLCEMNNRPTTEWTARRATCLRTAAVAHIDCSIMPAVIPSGVWRRRGGRRGAGSELSEGGGRRGGLRAGSARWPWSRTRRANRPRNRRRGSSLDRLNSPLPLPESPSSLSNAYRTHSQSTTDSARPKIITWRSLAVRNEGGGHCQIH